jgi:hypothetical protein
VWALPDHNGSGGVFSNNKASKESSMDKLKSKKYSKKRAISKAMAYSDSTRLASLGISAFASPDGTRSPDMKTLHQEIKKAVTEATLGDLSETEVTLICQVKMLDFLFNRLLIDAASASNPESFKACMDLALRAQNQCRKNIMALHALKNPQYTTFVKQQNVAFNQQVNNDIIESQKIKLENELLEKKDGQRLDTRKTKATIKAYSEMETLEVGGSKYT